MNAVDVVILVVVALAVYAEYSRGFYFALTDIGRALLALAVALGGYTLVARVFHSPVGGLVTAAVLAIGVLGLAAVLLKRMGEGPGWNKRAASRAAATLVGAPLGLAICFVFLPVAGRFGPIGRAAGESWIGSRMLDRLPALYEAADALDIEIPQFASGQRRFADEFRDEADGLAERINFRRLDGATCIECGSPVEFKEYRRLEGVRISPLFVCPSCGRRSDGCQTFEGFHEMYGRCPYEIATEGFDLDCGVWPNERLIQPQGICPVCGRGSD